MQRLVKAVVERWT